MAVAMRGREPADNKGGRPKGPRNRLSKAFVDALAKDFAEHGDAAVKILRVESPVDYCRLIGSVVPKELDLEVTNKATELREWMAWVQDPEIVEAIAATPRGSKRRRPIHWRLSRPEPPSLSRALQPEAARADLLLIAGHPALVPISATLSRVGLRRLLEGDQTRPLQRTLDPGASLEAGRGPHCSACLMSGMATWCATAFIAARTASMCELIMSVVLRAAST